MELLMRPTLTTKLGLAILLALSGGCVPSAGGEGSLARYGNMVDQGFAIPSVPVARVPRKFLRQSVTYATPYPLGTIVVDPTNRFVYLVRSGGRAIRYGVGVGIGAFAWQGEAEIGRKQEWPRWTPPKEMVKRAPSLARYEGGLDAGPLNPLGARALYLYQGGKDTLYRLHGTPEWWSIGRAGSSGCIRLLNQDVLDLYERVQVGTKVVVLPEQPKVFRR